MDGKQRRSHGQRDVSRIGSRRLGDCSMSLLVVGAIRFLKYSTTGQEPRGRVLRLAQDCVVIGEQPARFGGDAKWESVVAWEVKRLAGSFRRGMSLRRW